MSLGTLTKQVGQNRPVRCGKCKKEGHNSRECKAGITGETPWQRRQRLEKEKVVSNWDVNGTNKKTKKTKKKKNLKLTKVFMY